MSFGKDPKNLGSIGTFRQSSAMHQASRPKPGGAGARPYYIGQFRPQTDEPDLIRIIKGTYDVELAQPDGTIATQSLYYYPWIEHYHGTLKKGAICSGGPLHGFKDKREPCLGCDVYWADREAGKKNGPMSKSEKYAFTILHYATYAKVDQIDRNTGAVRTNQEGKPYTEWQRVFSHEKHHPKFQGKETREAQVLHWSLGFGHWGTLFEYDKLIGRSCSSCGGRDTVSMVAWTCAHCGEALIEAGLTTFSPKEIEEITGKEVRCASCQQVGMLKEYIQCSNCSNAQRAEIFDVDLSVQRIPDKSGKSNQTTLAITGWSNPHPIDARFTEMAKPLDLAKIFTPATLEEQASKFGGSPGGRQPVTAGQHSRAYGATPTLGKTGPQY